MRTQMKKYWKLVSVVMLVSILLMTLGACTEEEPTTTPAPVPHSITVQEDIANGTVTVDKESALKGETVTVTATPDENYVLVGITANGKPVENGSFTMGDEDVVVSATFALNSDRIETNAGVEGGTVITAPSMGGGDAQAQIFTVFGGNGIEFVAYVTDAGISEKDGVALLLSKKLPVINQLLPNGQTVKVAILTDGTATIAKTDADGNLVSEALPGTDVSVKLWTKDGATVQGYIVRANVSYEALGTDLENAKGNVTVCPVVYNAYGSVAAKATALGGALENAQNTYMVLTDDNTYAENPFKATSAQLGSAGGILAGNGWDLSRDYYKEDAENWPNRVAVLTGHDGSDNNLVFYGVSANEMYAEATIRITGVANPNDQWPKFGLMLFNGGSQSGVFYYVDAVMDGPSDNTTDNIIGTALGYNKAVNEWKSWQFAKDGVFNTTTLTITLQMVYQNGWVHMYANNAFVQSVWAGEYNENMHFGLKSFGLEMEVTNYMASDNAERDGWADKKIEEGEKADVDILFAGDSYMDFWKNRYQAAHMADYTTFYANEGIGGTVVPQWIQKVSEMSRLYNPRSIVFHIGVNDIDGGASVDTTVANLKTLFESYHELFPEAMIYWNSLIPNTMFPGEIADYYEVNAQVESYAADKDWLIYINQTPSFEKEPGVANPLYFDDGLHLSSDIGYPLWVKNMLTAMGYTREDSNNVGDVDGFAHSGGWTYQNGNAYLNASNEMATYFKGANGSIVYVEAMVSIGQLYNNDAYPKFGFTAHGDGQSLWGFIDAAGYPGNKNTSGFFVSRGIANNNGTDYYTGWNWDTVTGGGTFTGTYSDGEYVKLAIAKYNDTVYLLGNDKVLATAKLSGNVTVGFQVFNLETTLRDVNVIKDESIIKEKLGLVEPTSAVVDGKADDAIWTDEVLGNAIQMGSKGDGRYFETVAVKAPDGVYFLVTTYSRENTKPLSGNWWENSNVEFRFGNDTSQYYIYYAGPGFEQISASAGIAAVASDGGQLLDNGLWKTTAEFFVPYKTLTGFDANSAEIPVSLYGWVFDEGWQNGMNLGGFPLLSVSEHGLRFQRSVTVNGTNSAVSVIPSKNNAYVGDTVILDVQTSAALESITAATAGGSAVEVLYENGVYSFVMPDEDVTVTVKLQGISVSTQVEGQQAGGSISCDSGVVVPTDVVTFSVAANAGYKVVGVSVNGQALELTADGSYSYEVKDTDTGVAIAANMDYDTEGWVIDGVMNENELWGEELNFLVEDNRSVSVWAVKGQYGVYFYVRAYTNTMINDNASEWWMNHNFEFYLNHGLQSYVNTRGESARTSKHVWNSVQVADGSYAGKWMHTTEIFVHKDLIDGFDNGVTLNYAFKAPYEAARWEYIPNNQWDQSDWWRTSLGAPNDCETDFGKWEVPNWLKITDTGLINTRPAPQNGVVDAELNEYEGKLDLYRGNENAYFHIMGYEAADGVYLAFEIWQKNLAAATPEWHLNDNIEIQINGVQCGFSLYENFVAPWGNVNSWSMKRVESDREGYAYKTVVEIFVKMDNVTKHSYVFIGCNGNGFGGWQSLCWDGNLAWTSADGITDAWGAAADEGVTVDGQGNEALYAGKESVSFNINGATVNMTGAKLEHGSAFLFTVNHTRPVTDDLQGANDWWSYMNFEIYVGLDAPQAKASVWNNYSWWCASAYTTTDNGDGTYTTVMEVYIPYGLASGRDVSGDLLLGLGAVVDGGYNWLAVWDNNLYLTDKGVAYK